MFTLACMRKQNGSQTQYCQYFEVVMQQWQSVTKLMESGPVATTWSSIRHVDICCASCTADDKRNAACLLPFTTLSNLMKGAFVTKGSKTWTTF
eukprot:1421488-Amphidinium_carterae.1